MDNLFEIIIFASIFLLSLLFGRRKKRTVPGTGTRAQSPRQAASRARPRPSPSPRRPAHDQVHPFAEALGSRAIAEQILEQFRAATEPPPPPESVADDEAQSVETLEPAGGASHERFHERYIDSTPTAPPAVTKPRRSPLVLRPNTMRQAIIWREVLGPPKGLDG